MEVTFALLLLGALGAWVVTITARHVLSPLRSIPGPLLARFTKLWVFVRVWQGSFEKDNIALHRKYGKVVRYGPYHYSFDDPEAVKIIYGKGTEFDKSSWYEAWNAPGFKTLFTEPSVKVHGQLRRKFQATYSMSSLVTYEAFADDCIVVLKQRLEEIAKTGQHTDMARWLLCYAADTVAMITYSRRMGFLDAGEDVGDFFKNLHGNLFYSSVMGFLPGLHSLVYNTTARLSQFKIVEGTPRMSIARFTSNLISEKRRQRESLEKLKESATEVDENAPKDFLSKFLDSHEQDPARFTEQDISVGLIGNVIAGSDTTAAALTATLYCLLKNPSSLAKLREEISDRAGSGKLSSPPRFKEAHDMPYLQAYCKKLSACTLGQVCQSSESCLKVVLKYVGTTSQLVLLLVSMPGFCTKIHPSSEATLHRSVPRGG